MTEAADSSKARKAIDETVQGVRVKGKFDTNLVFFLGATLRRKF